MDVEQIAKTYYNSSDSDNYYRMIYGEEDLHVGIYNSDDDTILEAQRRTVKYLAKKLLPLDETKIGIDLGAGYGGACRYLAKTYGCKVVALNVSEKENEFHRRANEKAGLDESQIRVIDGSYMDIPFPDNTFDFAWSQDAILHGGVEGRTKVLEETFRVLKSGGKFVFTDPMESITATKEQLQPIYNRVKVKSMATPEWYKKTAESIGFEVLDYDNWLPQMTKHYQRILNSTIEKESELKKVVSDEYLEHSKVGLQHWVNGGKNGYMAWGAFLMQKP